MIDETSNFVAQTQHTMTMRLFQSLLCASLVLYVALAELDQERDLKTVAIPEEKIEEGTYYTPRHLRNGNRQCQHTAGHRQT